MSRRRRNSRRLAAALTLCGGALWALAPESAPPPASAVAAESAASAVSPAADALGATVRARELLIAGDESGAEAAYREALELDPESVDARVELGRLLLEHRRRWAARRELVRALELAPEHAEATYLLGVAYDELGFERLARRRYQRAFALAPELADPARHPEVVRNRQALAALLLLWQRGSGALDAAAAGGAHPLAAPAARSDAEKSAAPSQPPAPTGGGYARVEGSAHGTEPMAAEESPAARNGVTAVPGAPQRATPRRDAVLDPSDLRSGTSVNQIVAPGTNAPSGARRPPRGARRPPAPRFSPPPSPFLPDEDSTGRIEPRFEPVDRDAFAIAG